MATVVRFVGWIATMYIAAVAVLSVAFSLWYHQPMLVLPFITWGPSVQTHTLYAPTTAEPIPDNVRPGFRVIHE